MPSQEFSGPDAAERDITMSVVVGACVVLSWAASIVLWHWMGVAWLDSPIGTALTSAVALVSVGLWGLFGVSFWYTGQARDAEKFLSAAVAFGLLGSLDLTVVRLRFSFLAVLPPGVLTSVAAFGGVFLIAFILYACFFLRD